MALVACFEEISGVFRRVRAKAVEVMRQQHFFAVFRRLHQERKQCVSHVRRDFAAATLA
jgi:hypothetical protein